MRGYRQLSLLSPPIVLEFTPEQMWNPKNLIEFLKWYAPIPAMPETYSFLHCAGVWPTPIKDYLTLFITYKEEENASGYDPAPVIGNAAHPIPVAEPENKLMPVSIAPIFKKKVLNIDEMSDESQLI